MGWAVLVFGVYAFLAVAFILFHLQVLKNFEPEDWMVRGGLFAILLTVCALTVTWALEIPRTVEYLRIFLTLFFSAGVTTFVGFLILLWKHRLNRHSGAMQYYLRKHRKGN